MRKTIFAAVLVLVLLSGYIAAKSVTHEMVSKSEETSEVSKLLGTSIKNPQGENLGTITDVVPGPESPITFVVLSYWISDDMQKRVAVPLTALACNGKDCVLDANKDALDSAPNFVSEDDLGEPKLAGDIYRYFGLQPYWTEEGSKK